MCDLVNDTVFVHARRKWDMTTFYSQRSLFSSVWCTAEECVMKILQYFSAIQKQNAVTTCRGKTELTFALRHWQIYKLELQKWSNPQLLHFCFALCHRNTADEKVKQRTAAMNLVCWRLLFFFLKKREFFLPIVTKCSDDPPM